MCIRDRFCVCLQRSHMICILVCDQDRVNLFRVQPQPVHFLLQAFIVITGIDHMGALETDTELLFKDATVYLSEIENRYLTAEVRRKVYGGWYKLPLVKTCLLYTARCV